MVTERGDLETRVQKLNAGGRRGEIKKGSKKLTCSGKQNSTLKSECMLFEGTWKTIGRRKYVGGRGGD